MVTTHMFKGKKGKHLDSKERLRKSLLNNIHIWASKPYSLKHPKSKVSPRTLSIISRLTPLFFMQQHVFVNCVTWANLTKSVIPKNILTKDCSWWAFWKRVLLGGVLSNNATTQEWFPIVLFLRALSPKSALGSVLPKMLLESVLPNGATTKSNITKNVIAKKCSKGEFYQMCS